MKYVLLVGLVLAVLLEGTFTSLPLALLFLVMSASLIKGTDTFVLAFVAGIFLDALTMRSIGQSSIFFLILLLVVFLYEKKFEVSSRLFVTLAVFAGSSIYFIFFPASQSIQQSITVSVIGFIIFSLLKIRYSKDTYGSSL